MEFSESDVGSRAVWKNGCPNEESGIITSVGSKYVHVRFDGDLHSKGCYPRDLQRVGNLNLVNRKEQK